MPAAVARPRATLRPKGGSKPLDAGTGVVCASFGRDGSWLSLGAVHSVHGFVELSAAPPLDDSWRTDPTLVRRHRALLAEDGHAFLTWAVQPDEPPTALHARSTAAGVVHERHFEGWKHRATVRPSPGRRSIVQQHLLRATAGHPAAIVLTVRGRLDRPALGEITELEPPPPTGAVTRCRAAGSRLELGAPRLPASAWVTVEGPAGVDPAGVSWQVGSQSAVLVIGWPVGESELRFAIECGIGQEPA